MTNDERRIAIQQACGAIGNPLEDLNVMHEAETTLDGTGKAKVYCDELKWIICRDAGINVQVGIIPFCGDYRFLLATAAQRAEAFLRTIGKWKEEKQ